MSASKRHGAAVQCSYELRPSQPGKNDELCQSEFESHLIKSLFPFLPGPGVRGHASRCKERRLACTVTRRDVQTCVL